MVSLHHPCASRWGWRLAGLLGVLLAVALSTRAAAQDGPAGADTAAKAAEKLLPPEEQIDLLTGDGVVLKATYYPGTRGKDTVPVVLLHMYKGSRKDYARLALLLQREGHAVLAPDLRGHGDSTRVQGTTALLDVKSMPSSAFLPMVGLDMEACKKFLMGRNNAGEVNIEKLCLVGAEMGSVVAMDYARLDWSWPPLVNIKQGQDVKAVVLISPQWQFRSLQLRPALDQPAIFRQIATMIVVGEQDARAMREAKGVYSMLKRLHPTADAENLDARTLVFEPLATSLQGTKMLDSPELKLPQWIAWFIKVRVADQEWPWKRRESPQEGEGIRD